MSSVEPFADLTTARFSSPSILRSAALRGILIYGGAAVLRSLLAWRGPAIQIVNQETARQDLPGRAFAGRKIVCHKRPCPEECPFGNECCRSGRAA
jgi:hypothetical protein